MGAEKYVQVRTPDKVEIAHLVTRSKGPDRTMAQFSEDCQISASTLSRIVNGKITKPLSYDTIKKIYDNRATEDDNQLLDSLIRANGMMTKEAHERSLDKHSIYARRNLLRSRETTMKNIVVTELFDRGISIVKATSYVFGMDFNTTASEIFPGPIGDMAVTLGDQQQPDNVWAFYWFPQEPESEGNYVITAQNIVRRTISSISRLLLVDAWQPEIIDGLKTSFVFLSKEVFDRFLVVLRDAKINTEMSAVLLDIENGKVMEEQWLPGRKQQNHESLFSLPKSGVSVKDVEEYDIF